MDRMVRFIGGPKDGLEMIVPLQTVLYVPADPDADLHCYYVFNTPKPVEPHHRYRLEGCGDERVYVYDGRGK